MNEMKKYYVKGWIPLRNKYMVIEPSSYTTDWLEELVTPDEIIKIKLCDRYSHIYDGITDEEEKKERIKLNKFYKKCDSTDGFKIGDILSLIHQTYWSMVKKIYNNNREDAGIDNLCIEGFYFDSKTNTVIPFTGS